MAVICTIKRTAHSEDVSTYREFDVATLSGTYVPGGFTVNPFAIAGGGGTSPLVGSSVLAVQWLSPTGYIYVSTVAGAVMTTKIFSAPGTELAAGALPDASVPLIITKTKR